MPLCPYAPMPIISLMLASYPKEQFEPTYHSILSCSRISHNYLKRKENDDNNL